MMSNADKEKPRLAIWGAGGHAGVVADIVRQQGQYALAGFLEEVSDERRGAPFCGATILGGLAHLEALQAQGIRHVVMGFGHNRRRVELAGQLEARGFTLATAIHPRAVVAPDAVIGAGTVIAAGAVVNPGVTIGRNVIVNTASSVDHDCRIEDGVHICPGAHLAGSVTVGACTQVGLAAAVIQGIRLGADVLVGAGAVVVRDLPDGVLAYGVPARIQRKADA